MESVTVRLLERRAGTFWSLLVHRGEGSGSLLVIGRWSFSSSVFICFSSVKAWGVPVKMEARDHVYVCIRECVFVHVLGILGMSHGRRDASGTQLLALHESGEQMELCAEADRVLLSLLSVACSSLSLQSRWDDRDSQWHLAAASWTGAAVQGCANQAFVSCPWALTFLPLDWGHSLQTSMVTISAQGLHFSF